jgi:hypothetical protein
MRDAPKVRRLIHSAVFRSAAVKWSFHIVSIDRRHQQPCSIPSRADKVNVMAKDDGYSQSNLLIRAGGSQELIKKTMGFRELHRTGLHYCACSKTAQGSCGGWLGEIIPTPS